jgi:histidyl-tRNA synthetase
VSDEGKTGLPGLVEPATLKGFQDLLPGEMIARNRVIEAIRGVYEKYGFEPIDTPALESLETLVGTGGEAINKELFRLESPEGDAIAMRFDLTVPFARIVAQYPEKVKLPFRRYHIGPVFRADKPGPGRFRQFTQFDIDAAGSESVAADAEIIAAMAEALGTLGLRGADGAPRFRVRVNNRKLVDALLEGCGIAEEAKQKHILRVVDKLRKVGLEEIVKELGPGRIDASGDPIAGVGLDGATIEQIVKFIGVKGADRRGVLEAVGEVLPQSETSRQAIAEMEELRGALDALGVGEAEAVFDPSLARGLDYYTGPIFEADLPGSPEFGSIMGGGRYDGLVTRFLDRKIPATGASIGLDRLMAVLGALGKIDAPSTVTQVLVVNLKWTETGALLALVKELREAGIAAELYLGEAKAGMKAQMSYANAKGIPVAVILGPDELANGTVAVKDLVEGKEKREGIEDHADYKKSGRVSQVTVARGEMVATIRGMLAGE